MAFFCYTTEMADSSFPASVPVPQDSAPRIPREANIAHAAELGRKISEHEKDLQGKITLQRDAEAKNAHAMASEASLQKKEVAEKQKEFRSVLRTREQEVVDDKKRREKQAQLALDSQKSRTESHKKAQGYMKELHVMSLQRQAVEKRLSELKVEKEHERQRVETDHQNKIRALQHADGMRKEVLEHDLRAHKSVIDADVKTREYQLEEWKRSRLMQLENEAMRQLASAISGRTPLLASHIRGTVDAQIRIKRKKLDTEWLERKVAMQQEASHRKHDMDNDFYARKTQSESELHRLTHMIDTELSRRYEDIEQRYKALIIAAKS